LAKKGIPTAAEEGFKLGVRVLEGLIAGLRERCAGLPDRRTGGNGRYAMADIGLAAFSVFFMQSPSFLAHQRSLVQERGRSNCQTLFGMTAIPSDNHIRQMLDGTPASHFDPLFGAVLSVLIALDGSEYFASRELHWPYCSRRRRRDGSIESFHAFLGAALVAPGHGHVLPLPAEFITPRDGGDKQDRESRAVQRWLGTHGRGYARLDPVYLGDDLYSRQPTCAAVTAAGGHFIFVCKPSSHQTIEEYLTGIELPEHRVPEHRVTVRRGRDVKVHRYRWIEEEYREFRVWAMTMETEEASHGTTQTACHSGRTARSVAGRGRREDRVRQGRPAGRTEEGSRRAGVERGARSSSRDRRGGRQPAQRLRPEDGADRDRQDGARGAAGPARDLRSPVDRQVSAPVSGV
jgi:hypothetical protein